MPIQPLTVRLPLDLTCPKCKHKGVWLALMIKGDERAGVLALLDGDGVPTSISCAAPGCDHEVNYGELTAEVGGP